MAKNQTVGSLSIVGVISAGLRIYRDHFKDYFTIALQAYCWSIIPIYGWAKLFALSALISRLAYHEILEQPEAISQARPLLEGKMWSFLGQAILIGLIVGLGVNGLVIFGSTVFWVISSVILTVSFKNASIIYFIGLGFVIAFLFACFWLMSRICIAALILAVEDNMTETAAIIRSWKLTKGSVLRIQGILFLCSLIGGLISSILGDFIMGFIKRALALASIISPHSSNNNLTVILFYVAMYIIVGALILPFSQSIAGVIYYDLRVRREGRTRLKNQANQR